MLCSDLYQVSGAGYPGVSSMDIIDNVIPFISGEEEKLEIEAQKILGTTNDDLTGFTSHHLRVTASCNRYTKIYPISSTC